MTYTLYSHDGSGGFAAEAALIKAGADFKTIVIDTTKGDQNRADFAAINPMKQVPTLILPDGTIMTESAAIVVHLANAFPGKGLAPAPGSSGHARFLRWMFFMAANIYEGDLRYYYPDRYITDPTGIEGVKAAGAAHMTKSFAVVEQALEQGPFLCGKEMNMADVYLAMVAAWSPEPLTGKKILALRAAVAEDKTFGPLWRRHGFER